MSLSFTAYILIHAKYHSVPRNIRHAQKYSKQISTFGGLNDDSPGIHLLNSPYSVVKHDSCSTGNVPSYKAKILFGKVFRARVGYSPLIFTTNFQ